MWVYGLSRWLRLELSASDESNICKLSVHFGYTPSNANNSRFSNITQRDVHPVYTCLAMHSADPLARAVLQPSTARQVYTVDRLCFLVL